MAFDAQGNWKMESDDVESKLTGGLLSPDNPLMKQAEFAGKSYSASRGLINSSIGAQAGQEAAYKVALPIASQDASQTSQKNLTQMGIAGQKNIATMNVAAGDRQNLAAAQASVEQSYSNLYNSIMSNTALSAAQRTAQLTHINAIRDSNYGLIEQIYSTDLDWATAA
jgi:hypothetical protein